MRDNQIQFATPFNEVFVNEFFYVQEMTLGDWEMMLTYGWRHNGTLVFRNSHDYNEYGETTHVLPLRYRTFDFFMSKSQRKIWRKNSDLRYRVIPTCITDEIIALFEFHKTRFKYRKPESIWDFVNEQHPFKTYQMEMYKADKLIGITFIDITKNAVSSTYAAFDLNESHRSLGHFSMLLEMQFARENERRLHYPGYAFLEESHMDYKKRFRAAEHLDWLTMTWKEINDAEKVTVRR